MPEDEQRTSAAVLDNAESRVPGAFERGNSKGRARLAITSSSRCHHKETRDVLLSAAEALVMFRTGLSWRSSAVKRPHASNCFILLDNRQVRSSDARFRGSTRGRGVAITDCMRGMSPPRNGAHLSDRYERRWRDRARGRRLHGHAPEPLPFGVAGAAMRPRQDRRQDRSLCARTDRHLASRHRGR